MDGDSSWYKWRDGNTIEINRGNRAIPEFAFKQFAELEEVIIPDSVDFIRRGAFYGCRNLKSVRIPAGVRVLDEYAFAMCTSLESAILPSSLESIGSRIFYGCKSLASIHVNEGGRYGTTGGILYDLVDRAVVRCPPKGVSGKVRIREETEKVCDDAFAHCTGLTNLSFGGKLRCVNVMAFDGCDSLGAFGASPYLKSGNGDTLFLIAPASGLSEVSLEGTRFVAPHAFEYCPGIRDLYIPSCVEYIDESCFTDLSSLDRIEIEEGFDSELPLYFYDVMGGRIRNDDIGGHVFERCGHLSYTAVAKFETPPDRRPRSRPRARDQAKTPAKTPSAEGKTITFDDVAGLEDVKQEFMDRLILPVNNPELFEEYGLETSTGVLMYGPPGNGKTMLARAVAGELGAAFYGVKPSDIYDRWVGSEEHSIRDLFAEARKHPRSVIFFDDFDSIGMKRGHDRSPWLDATVNELLTQMQGVETFDNTLIVLAATNRPWVLDSALLRSGRFSVRIHVPLPDREARLAIIENNLGRYPCRDVDFDALADATEGYSGADVKELCDRAKIRRVRAVAKDEGPKGVGRDDVEYALSMVHSSVDPKDLEDIERYEKTGNGPRGAGESDGGNVYVPGESPTIGYQ